MKHLSLTSKQRTRTADLLEKTSLAVLIAILGSSGGSVWSKAVGSGIAVALAIAAVVVERAGGRKN